MKNRLLAIGDIHGCFSALKELVERKIKLHKSDRLVFLGDYIDRGPQSKDVIDYIIKLKEEGFDIIPLKGNHEAMLLEAYSDKDRLPQWIQNGGEKTLNSFGIDTINDLAPKYLEFFKNLNIYYELEEYLFVHAGLNDELENPLDDLYTMLWKCRKEYNHPSLKEKVIVHGHCTISGSTCDRNIMNKHNVINLDTGCVYSGYNGYGRLTALELNTRTIYFA